MGGAYFDPYTKLSARLLGTELNVRNVIILFIGNLLEFYQCF